MSRSSYKPTGTSHNDPNSGSFIINDTSVEQNKNRQPPSVVSSDSSNPQNLHPLFLLDRLLLSHQPSVRDHQSDISTIQPEQTLLEHKQQQQERKFLILKGVDFLFSKARHSTSSSTNHYSATTKNSHNPSRNSNNGVVLEGALEILDFASTTPITSSSSADQSHKITKQYAIGHGDNSTNDSSSNQKNGIKTKNRKNVPVRLIRSRSTGRSFLLVQSSNPYNSKRYEQQTRRKKRRMMNRDNTVGDNYNDDDAFHLKNPSNLEVDYYLCTMGSPYFRIDNGCNTRSTGVPSASPPRITTTTASSLPIEKVAATTSISMSSSPPPSLSAQKSRTKLTNSTSSTPAGRIAFHCSCRSFFEKLKYDRFAICKHLLAARLAPFLNATRSTSSNSAYDDDNGDGESSSDERCTYYEEEDVSEEEFTRLFRYYSLVAYERAS